MSDTVLYSVRRHTPAVEFDLPKGREYVFPGFFFGWLIQKGFLSEGAQALLGSIPGHVRDRQLTGAEALHAVDGVLDAAWAEADCLTFCKSYFDLMSETLDGDGAHYHTDFCRVFEVDGSMAQLYTIEDSWENHAKIARAIDMAYLRFRMANSG